MQQLFWVVAVVQIGGVLLSETIVQQILIESHDATSNSSSDVEDTDSTTESPPVQTPMPTDYVPRWLMINPSVCLYDAPFLLVVVHSSPTHFKRRETIRQTWGSPHISQDLTMRTLFFVGVDRNISKSDSQRLNREHNDYADIVQADFTDTYRNLTYKAISWLYWVNGYCDTVPYVLKADDDVFVDSRRLLTHLATIHRLSKYPDMHVSNTIFCRIWEGAKVSRRKKDKWYVAPDEFDADKYTRYCAGAAFVLTNDALKCLKGATHRVPFFWIDDYYVTGMLANHCNVSLRRIDSLCQFDYVTAGKHITNKDYDGITGLLLHLPNNSEREKRRYWRYLINRLGTSDEDMVYKKPTTIGSQTYSPTQLT